MCNDSAQIPVLAKTTYDFTFLAGTATQTVVLLPYVDVSGYYRAHLLVRLHISQMSAGQKVDFELDHTLPSDEDPAEFIDRWGKVGTHSKILIVSGPLKTGGNRSSVFTGSTNFSEPDSQPDAWVGVHDDALIFSQYINWWKWLCTSTAMSTSGLGACTGPQEKT
ncbi:MAG TPA: hypothetical protein PKW35_04950 [Nannocystaceae bacterium]|nr:hypothetical protein [Nannocystaceae bacterium]